MTECLHLDEGSIPDILGRDKGMEPAFKVVPLNNSNLGALANAAKVPTYDRQTLTPGIVHVGVGGFNRSHLAVYLDDLLQRADTRRWGEWGLGLLLGEGRQLHILSAVVASWLYYFRGIDEAGRKISVEDQSAALFASFCEAGARDVRMALSVRVVFGDLADAQPDFVLQVSAKSESSLQFWRSLHDQPRIASGHESMIVTVTGTEQIDRLPSLMCALQSSHERSKGSMNG
jgi:hypothetical protein